MKKVVTMFVLVFAFTLTTQAQREHKGGDFEKLSTEQQTDLAVKKMTLKLDLTPAQQRQIKPLVAEKIASRKAMKESGKEREKLSADERYKKQDARLDKMIAFKKEVKSILTPEQFEKFEKSVKNRMGKRKKGMKKRRMHKKRKELKEEK